MDGAVSDNWYWGTNTLTVLNDDHGKWFITVRCTVRYGRDYYRRYKKLLIGAEELHIPGFETPMSDSIAVDVKRCKYCSCLSVWEMSR